VKAFAELLDRLAYTPSRNDKLRLLAGYFASAPDPDRGFALAALTDGLFFRLPLRRILTDLIAARVDPVLFDLSRDYVGDTAETIALIWPAGGKGTKPPRLAAIVEALRSTPPAEIPALLAGWLDTLDATGRWALLKLLTGALRVGVSARPRLPNGRASSLPISRRFGTGCVRLMRSCSSGCQGRQHGPTSARARPSGR
jgi:DNA ligase-1